MFEAGTFRSRPARCAKAEACGVAGKLSWARSWGLAVLAPVRAAPARSSTVRRGAAGASRRSDTNPAAAKPRDTHVAAVPVGIGRRFHPIGLHWGQLDRADRCYCNRGPHALTLPKHLSFHA